MSRVIEGQRIQRVSLEAAVTIKPKGQTGEKMTVFHYPEIKLQKGPQSRTPLDAKLTVMSLQSSKDAIPHANSGDVGSCQQGTCKFTDGQANTCQNSPACR